jgi:hypothetical protein
MADALQAAQITTLMCSGCPGIIAALAATGMD